MGSETIPTKRAILIAGPTASGKSAVASALAQELGGVVINVDAMQVYRDLRILTARPSAAEEARVPHRLFGHVDAAQNYSLGHWLREVGLVLAEAESTGMVPVLVGGTGLYIKALTQGLSAIPPVPPSVRDRLRADAVGVAPAKLHARLLACDPVMASRLRPTDPQRILRALEVFEATGQSLAVFQQTKDRPVLPGSDVIGVFLAPDREQAFAAIDRRFDMMIASGALDEVARLAERTLDPTLPAMRALGVADLMKVIEAPEQQAKAVEAAKLATRRYAKRQFTFARHQLPLFDWVDPNAARAIVSHRWGKARA